MNQVSRAVFIISLLSLLFACGDKANPTAVELDATAARPDTVHKQTRIESTVSESTPQTAADTPVLARGLLDPNELYLAPQLGDLDAMRERGVVRILTVYSTGQYYIHKGEERGFTKELAVLFEKFLNRANPRKAVKLRVVIVPVARNELIPSLLAGRGDLILANLSITDERKALIDFSIPASKPLSEILVTGPSAPPLASIEDLSGKVVHVRHSSSYRESLESLNERLAGKNLPAVHIEPVSEFLEDEDLIEMVNTGLLPWIVIDDYKVVPWKNIFTELTPRTDIVLRKGGQIAWGFRQNSPKLAEEANAFLKKNRQGTLVGNVLIERYITDFDWTDNAFSDDDFARFQSLLGTFKKYGEMYEIDYLLAAAQGYQESRLNQNARSKAGAIGIMQLLPSTAKDHNIAIDNIDQAENNIQAGIKYLSFLRNRYFTDPGIDETDQTLMALAAYNLGPARMINVRNKAQKRGYDPDIWFDNVELAAAAHVGREPVQYVANIYKYYVAYRGSLRDVTLRNKAREKAGIEQK